MDDDTAQSHEPLGEVFTRRWVVEWMLDLVGWTTDKDLTALTLVEPSCGSGAFIVPIVERLVESARRHGVALDELGDVIWACDLHEPSVDASRAAATSVLVDAGLDRDAATAVASKWFQHTDFLLAEHVPTADVVIGNPPYVRHDEIPRDLALAYRESWPTMRGRCDLYVPFYERGLVSLRSDGALAYICADRWMRNQYGKGLRSLVHDAYSVDTVIRMHQVDAFEDEVDAYPAITIVRRGEQGNGVLADCKPDFTGHDVPAAQTVLSTLRAVQQPAAAPRFSAVRLDGWFDAGVWPEGDAEQIEKVKRWEQSLRLLERAGATKIGIGVATGADRIYVVKGERPDIEPERLLPTVKARHLSGGELAWQPTWLVNPWDADGVVDLDAWPRFAAYMRQHEDVVAKRHVAKRNPDRWHRTIDRVHPDLTSTPKVLLADMAERMTPVVDDGNYYPHHNVYWITSDEWDPYVLAGLLLSDQAEAFIRAYCVKMRGGTLRMQAQYLRTIRVPEPDALTDDDRAAFTTAYLAYDREAATAAAEKFYG